MKNPEVPTHQSVTSPRTPDPGDWNSTEVASILSGLERQKEELGPIAEELIDLLHHLGVGKPPRQVVNPSSE